MNKKKDFLSQQAVSKRSKKKSRLRWIFFRPIWSVFLGLMIFSLISPTHLSHQVDVVMTSIFDIEHKDSSFFDTTVECWVNMKDTIHSFHALRHQLQESCQKQYEHKKNLSSRYSLSLARELLEDRPEIRSGFLTHVEIRNYDQIEITLTPRTPEFIIKIKDQILYLDVEGYIFSRPNEDRPDLLELDLPSLLSETKKKSGDHAYNQALERKKRVSIQADARLLAKAFFDLEVPLNQITFDPYRGYSLKTTHDSTWVIGHPPFQSAFQKLLKIKKSADSDPDLLSKFERIELDFIGRAYIKEKNS